MWEKLDEIFDIDLDKEIQFKNYIIKVFDSKKELLKVVKNNNLKGKLWDWNSLNGEVFILVYKKE